MIPREAQAPPLQGLHKPGKRALEGRCLRRPAIGRWLIHGFEFEFEDVRNDLNKSDDDHQRNHADEEPEQNSLQERTPPDGAQGFHRQACPNEKQRKR